MQEGASLKEAILRQATEEGEKIIAEAEQEAGQVLQSAKQQRDTQLETIRLGIIQQANKRMERTQAEAKAQAKKATLQHKTRLIAKLRDDVRKQIETSQSTDAAGQSIKKLLVQALQMFPQSPRLRITVRDSQMSVAKKVIEELGLSSSATIEGTGGIIGGVMIESADGLIRVDNSCDTRLKSYFRASLPEINRALFES
ncbi:MAG: V-type ATP synthase subunit E family protein [archaeon]